MAITLRSCILFNLVYAGFAADPRLEAKLVELEKLYLKNHDQINGLEGEIRSRRLAGHKKSIYGVSSSRQTVAYTAADNIEIPLTCMWLILCGALVMFMQAGFAVREMGFGRRKFAHNILLKNLTAVCLSVWGFYFIGWSLAYTGPWRTDFQGQKFKDNGFMGYESFAAHDFILDTGVDGNLEPTLKPLNWFFQWSYSAVAATVACSGPADRLKPGGYIAFLVIFTTFIYPIIYAWTWGRGWIADTSRIGMYDQAGSGIVHLTGGSAALVGALLGGAREGRFRPIEPGERDPCQPHSLPLAVLGTFILWFGWYGYNCGSILMMSGIEYGFQAAQIAMNTTIAASGAGLTAFILMFFLQKMKYDIGSFCGGVLAGLVSISAGCKSVECGSAVAIGCCGAVVYVMNLLVLRKVKIDDPVDAWAIHGACGIWGCIAGPLFDWGKNFEYVHGPSGFRCHTEVAGSGPCRDPWLWQGMFLSNLIEIGMILAWSGGLSLMIFLPLKITKQLTSGAEPHELNAYTDYEGMDRDDFNPKSGSENQPI